MMVKKKVSDKVDFCSCFRISVGEDGQGFDNCEFLLQCWYIFHL